MLRTYHTMLRPLCHWWSHITFDRLLNSLAWLLFAEGPIQPNHSVPTLAVPLGSSMYVSYLRKALISALNHHFVVSGFTTYYNKSLPQSDVTFLMASRRPSHPFQLFLVYVGWLTCSTLRDFVSDSNWKRIQRPNVWSEPFGPRVTSNALLSIT